MGGDSKSLVITTIGDSLLIHYSGLEDSIKHLSMDLHFTIGGQGTQWNISVVYERKRKVHLDL